MMLKMACAVSRLASRLLGVDGRFSLGAVLLLGSGVAAATTTINQQFTPATINPGDESAYRITIANSSLVALSDAAVRVALPNAITIADGTPTFNTCSFTVDQASQGTSIVYLTNGTVPAGNGTNDGTCYVEIPVSSVTAGNHIATIPANTQPDATTSGYSALENGVLVYNTTPASATLSVNTLQNPTGSKSFSPSPAIAGDPTTLTITLSNPNTGATIPLTTFTDNLPTGMVVADPATASTTCSGGSVTADPGASSITLTGGVIPVKVGGANGTCTITAKVVAAAVTPAGTPLNNALGSGAIGNTRGLTSPAFNQPLTVNTPIAVSKSFSPSTIPSSQPSLMTLTITNNSTANALDITSFADDLTGTTLKILDSTTTPARANPAVTCDGAGAVNGTLSYTPNADTTLTLTGAKAGPKSGSTGKCVITAYVTSAADGDHTNTILANAVVNPNNYPSPAKTADLTVSARLTVEKTVSVSHVAPGQYTVFTITIKNWSEDEIGNISFKDILPVDTGDGSDGTKRMVLDDNGGAIYTTDEGCRGGNWFGTDENGIAKESAPAVGDPGITWTSGIIEGGVGVNPGVCTITIRAKLPDDATKDLAFENRIPVGGVTDGSIGNTNVGGDSSPENNSENDADIVTVSSIAVNKSFKPASIAQGGQSTLTIRIRNRVRDRAVSPLTGVNLTDNLPPGLRLAANPQATNDCGGTLQAFPNDTKLTLTGGSVPARPDADIDDFCTITAKVTGSTVGSHVNTIQPADLSTPRGTIPEDVSATLAIGTGLTGSKTFTPTAVAPGGVARVKFTVINGSSGQLTNVSANDSNFGAGLAVANPANASTNCGGSPTVVANPGATSAQLLGVTLPAGGSCDFFFDVVTSGSSIGPWSNTIPVGQITSAEGPASTAAVTATLGVQTAQININKSFNPVIVTGGQPSVLAIDVINPSAIAMHGVGFTDTFPLGIEVYSVPNASTTCPGGVVTAIPGDGKVILSGATLAANQTCQVYVTTTSVRFLNLTNSIPAQAVVNDEGYTNPQGTAASLSTLQGLGIMKGFAPDFIGPNDTARLKMRLVSTFDPNAPTPVTLTGVSYTDTLPAGVVVAATPGVSTNCAGSVNGSAVVTAVANSNLITVSSATIPPGSSCTIEVDVTASALGAYTNVIPQNSVTSDQGIPNQIEARATLNVVTSPTVTKAFANPSRNPGQSNRLTVTINNNDPNQALTGVSLTDTLPAGLAIAATPNAGTTCTGGAVSAVAGGNTLRLTNATIAQSASCTFYADAVGNAAGSYTNNINANALVTNQGVTNPGAATAVMAVGNPPTVSKSFSPVSITAGNPSTLTINLANSNANAITLSSDLVDVLPGNAGGTGQLVVAGAPAIGGTCASGSVTALAGASSITYASGATIPAGGCTITVPVTAATDGVYTNIIAAGQLETSGGKNQQPASASLAVGANALVPPTVAKSFSPGSVAVNGTSRLTITLGNPNESALTLSADFTDNLPANVVIATTPNIGNGASACPGTVTADAGAALIKYASGATIPSGGCTIQVDVKSATAGSYTNTIAAGDLKTNGGNNLQPTSAGLVVQAQTPPTVTKSFNPVTINPGGTSRLTINLGNANAGDITLSAGLTDTLPSGVTVAGTPNVGGTCATGSVTAAANSGTITYASGATIPAGGCTIQVDVTASDSTNSPYTNTIAVDALNTSAGNNGAAATARLFVNPPQPPSLSKSFTPSTILVNGTSTLTLSFGNGNNAPTTLIADLVDTLPAAVKVAANPNIRVSTGCTVGKVVAVGGAGTVTYQTGGAIPAGGCSVSVDVTSSVASEAGHLNSIAAGALKTGYGDSAVKTEARLKVTNLAVSKSVHSGSGPYAIGDLVTYKVTVTVPPGLNGQPFVAKDVTITDTLPAGLEYVSGFALGAHANLTIQTPSPTLNTADNEIIANFGSVTNATSASQTFDVTYQVRVLNFAGNQIATPPKNAVVLSTSDTANTWTAEASMTLGEPALSLTKSMSPTANLKAGDTVTITLTATNTGSVPAYRIKVTDVLNDGTGNELFDLASANIANTSTGSGLTNYDFAYDQGTGTVTYTAKDAISLAANGGSVTFTFTATVSANIISGWTYSNTASIEGNSQNTPAIGRSVGPTNSNTITTGPTVTGAVTKTIAATSQTFTDTPKVAIGETVTYDLTFTLPKGITKDVILADSITAGNIGDVVLVGATLARSNTSLSAANNPGTINGAAVNTPVAVTLATGIAAGCPADGQFCLALGDVNNSTSANASDTYTLSVTLRITNVANNTAGHAITDQGRIYYDNASGTQQNVNSGTQTVTVALPQVGIVQSVTPGSPSAGDTLTYTLTITNTSGANSTTGFDWRFTDTLPAELINPTVTGTNAGTTGATINASFSENDLSGTIDHLDPGESITITYTAQVKSDTPYGKTLTTAPSATATTLSGIDANERTGAGGVNNITNSTTQSVVTSTPTLSKVVVDAQTRYAIGDIVHYRLTLGVAVGTTTNLSIADTLPPGLTFLTDEPNAPVITPGTGITTSSSSHSGTGTVTFNLGEVTATQSGNIVIDYYAQVANVSGNQNGQSRTNAASASYDKPGGGTLTSAVASEPSVTIGEPNLTMTKTILSGATGSQAGDTVRYQFTVKNEGTTTAYQMTVRDQLPDGLHNLSVFSVTPSGGNVQTNNAGCTSGNAVSTAAVTTTTNTNDTLTIAGICIAPGGTLTVVFDAVLMDSVQAGQFITNSVRANYASQPTGSSGTAVVRDNATNPNTVDDDVDTDLNNYADSASIGLTVAAPIAIDKQADKTQATIGELVTYTLKVSVIEGVTPSVIVTDVLPAGLTYVSHTISVGNAPMTLANASYDTRLGTGQTVQFNLGNLSNPSNGIDMDDFVTIAIVARVDNIAGNQAEPPTPTVLKNGEGGTVTVRYGTTPTTVTYDYDTNIGGIQGRPLTIVEPALTLTKTANPAAQALGDLVTYTINLTNTGSNTSAAFDLVITDTLPAGLTYEPNSASLALADVTIAGQNLTFRISTLASGASTSFTYQARIASSASVGTALTNSASVTWKSLSGADKNDAANKPGRTGQDGAGGLNNYIKTATAPVTPTTNAAIDAVKTVTDINSGMVAKNDTLEYTITLRNTGSVNATNVVFTDPIPANTTYVIGSSKLNGIASGNVNSGTLTVTVGDLAVNATATITFQVNVNTDTAGTVISNQGSVDSDQTVPEPTDVDGIDANGDQPTEVTVGQPISGGGGALYARKTVNAASVATGGTVTYTITLTNTGSTALTDLQFSDTVPSQITVTDASSPTATVTRSGQVVTASLVSLAPSTSAALTITGTAGATGTVNNQGAVTYTDGATSPSTLTDFDGLPGNGNQPTPVTIVSGTDPQLDVQKRWSLLTDTAPLGVPSPGDTLLYTTTIRNVGGAPAENVRFSDPVPTHTALAPNSVVTSQGAVTSATASSVTVNLGTLTVGATATVSFQVAIAADTTNGTVLSNQATVTRTGDTTGVASDDNGTSGDGLNPTLTPVYTEAPTPVLAKTQSASSETDSTESTVLIGEVVTFELAFSVPPGTTRQLTFADTLPTGLAYVAESARLRRTSTTLNAALNPGGINSANADDPVTLIDDVHLLQSAQTLSLALGNVINSDANDATTEQYILQYRARVQNLAGNAKGATLTNSATIRTLNTLGVEQTLTPKAVELSIIEPSLTLDKSVNPAALLSTGGATTYTLVITNTGTAPAYDVCLTDPLSADWTLGTVTATPSATDAPTGITVKQDAAADDCGSDRLRVQVAVFPAGGVLTLSIPVSDTDLSSALNDQLNNTATATWTSLPGATGSGTGLDAAGEAGTSEGERTGAGSGVNLYTVSDSAQVTINQLNLTKTVGNTRRYAIGELATYRLDISVPAGYSVTDAVIKDVLPAGLLYVGPVNRVDTNTALTNGTLTAGADGTPPTLTITLGTLSNSAATAQTLSLDYAVRVDNVAGNQFDTAPLGNTATLTFKDPRDGNAEKTRTATASLQLGEPQLSLTLNAVGPDGALTGLQAGDVITYTLTVSNASGAGVTTAFDSLLSSVLPNGLTGVSDSLVNTASSHLSSEVLTALLATLRVDAAGLSTAAGGFDLPVGASVTLTFQATLDAGVLSGETLTATTASVTYTSLDGAEATERTGSGAPAVNDYQASDSAQTLTIDSTVAFDKTFLSDTRTTFAVGEEVTYRLRVDLIEGTTNNLVVTDTLPAGLSYVGYTLGAGSGASLTIPFDPATDLTVTPATGPSETGQVVVFALGTVINTANGQRDDDYLTIDLTARVDNVIANQAGTVLGNHARLEYVDAGGAKTLNFDANGNAGDGLQPLDLTVMEPTVTLGLTQNVDSLSLGDTVTYTLTLSAGGANAYGVRLVDTLPPGLEYVSATGGAPTIDGQTLTFDLAQLAQGDSHQITITARLRPETTVGETQLNQATLTWGSIPGATGTADSGRIGSDGAGEGLNNYATGQSVSLTPTINAVIDATKTVTDLNGGNAEPGDTLEYRVTLTNTGSVLAADVIFTDAIPDNTTYVNGSTTLNGVSLADSGGALSFSEGVMMLQVGTLAVADPDSTNDTAVIRFQVKINDGVPAGIVIRNQGLVDSDQTVPTPTDGDGNPNNGAQPTDLPVGGQPALTGALYAEKTVTWRTDADSSNTVNAGDTLHYTIVLRNRGAGSLTGLSFSDTIPTGLTYAGSSIADSGSVTVADQTVTWTDLAELPPGASHTLSFDVTIASVTGDSQTFSNQGTATSSTTGAVLTDSNGDPSDGTQPTTITAIGTGSGTPALDLQKRWSLVVDGGTLGQVDPGDTLQYTITVTNTGAQAASDVRLTDTPLPTQLSYVADSLITSRGVVESQNPIAVNLGTLDPGQIATVSFRLTVNENTAGQIARNQALVTRDGDAQGVRSDDNGNPDDGRNPTLTPIGTMAPAALTKTLFTTSQGNDAGAGVQIGEILTYQIQFAVPPGTTGEVTLTDTLPKGLSYVPGTVRLQRVFDTGLSASRNPGGINATAGGTFTDLSDGTEVEITAATAEQGPVLSVFLGTVINSDNDDNSERYILEIQARVDNIAANQAGTALNNTVGLSYRDTAGRLSTLSPVTHTATLSEPALQLTKQADVNTLLAGGGTVRYTLTLTNPSGPTVGTGYEVTIADTLPTGITSASLVDASPTASGGVTDANCTMTDATPPTLSCTAAVFLPNGQLIVVYDAVSTTPLTPGTTLTNAALATWTSLAGVNSEERTGSGTSPNDYRTSTNRSVLIGTPALVKSIPAPQTRYAIGDEVTYQVVLSIPGTLSNAVFADVLPVGLTYVADSLSLAYADGLSATGNPSAFTRTDNTPGAGQETLTLNFGALTNTSGAVKTLTLTYRARVDNRLVNQDGDTLTNAATLRFDTPGGSGTQTLADDAALTLGEPKLALTQTITSSTTGLEAGDTVTYRVTVKNTGTTPAFETLLSEALPPELRHVQNLSVVSLTNTSNNSETPTLNAGDDGWSSSPFDLHPGDVLTLEFTVTLQDTAQPGQVLQAELAATYGSRDGDDANERDGSTPASSQDDDTKLNNYNVLSLSPTITVRDPVNLDKTFHPDPARVTYTIGATVGYRLTLAVTEGTTRAVVLTDTLPDGVTLIGTPVIGKGHTGITFGNTGTLFTQNGQVLTFTLGDVVNPATGITTDDVVTIDIQARIDNVTANQAGTVLGNHVQVQFTDGANVPQTRDYDADAVTAGIQPLNLTLVEPVLDIRQSVDRALVSLGDTGLFMLTLDHLDTSTADAFDLKVVITLDEGLTYVPGSASTAPDSVSGDGRTLTWTLASLTQATDNTTLTYQAQVANNVTVGLGLSSQATLTYASQSGATGAASSGRTGSSGEGSGLNNYAASQSVSLTPTTNAVIAATKTVTDLDGGDALAGDTLEYRVLLKNTGADTAFNVVFTDAIPANTTYVEVSSVPVGAIIDEALTVDVGTLASQAEVTLSFRVRIDTDVPIGATITNQGVVDSDQTVPTPTNRADIRIGGELVAGTLYAQKTVAKVGTGTTIGNGDTVQYSLTLQNTGATTLTDARLTDTLPADLTYVTASASTTTGTITVVDGRIIWAAGDLVGNAAVTATFRATVSGVPLNSRRDFANQATVAYTDPTNRPRVTSTDSNGTASDGNQPTVFTAVNGTPPRLDARKSWELTVDKDANGLPSANDTLRYSVVVTNTGAEAANNVRLTDAIPANTAIVPGSVTTSQGAVTGSSPVAVNLGNLAAGQTATIDFQVVIGSNVVTGTVIQNQADVSATGLTASSNTTLTTVINGAQFPTPIGKLVVAHSEAVTDTSKALIGEVLTYRLTISIPPGETQQVRFLDTLPSGLRYLGGSARLARSANSLVSSLNPGGINEKAGYGSEITDSVFVDVSATVASDDQTLILALGDVTNANASGNASYVLHYQVVVLNASGNVRGTDLSNFGTVSYWNALSVEQTATPMQATVRIHEPGLTLDMTAGPSSLLSSGGMATYTLTVTNTGDAPAYDVRITDALPAVFTGASTATGGCAVAGLTLNCDIAAIAPGASVTLSVNATAGSIPGNQITNSATATWTSVPGAKGTGNATPGAAGDLDGERTGDTGRTGSNGYTTSASATIVVGLPSLTKTIENPQAHYAVGEIINYRVTASLPAGLSLSGARLVDTLPVGLSYVAGSASETLSVSGQTLTFDLGTLNTTTRTLTYQARVDNRLSNQNNTALTNGAQLLYTNPGTGAPTQTAIQSQTALVGEPYLGLTLNVTPTAGLQAGDTVTYSLTLTNSGPATTAAHGVNLNDLLPIGLSGVPGTLRVSGVGEVGAGAFILDAAGLTTATPFTLPVGATLILSFDARLTSDVMPSDSLLNQAEVDFASLAGDTTHARTGSDGPSQDDPNLLDNYSVTAQAPAVTIGDTLTIDKRFHPDPARNRYTVGEPLTYRLTLNLIEGRTESVVVTDTLPAGVLYEGSEIGVGSLGMVHEFDDSARGLTIDTVATGRTRLTFDLGTVINPADGRRDNDYLTIDIQARVANNAATNPEGATLGNHAQVEYLDGTGQSLTQTFDADALTDGVQPLDLTVIEPRLAIEKSADATEPLWLDDEVTYTLTITHQSISAADAFDLVVTDRLPDGLTYVAATGQPAPEVDGQTLTFRVPSLTLSQGRTTLSYRARVDETALAGESLINQARLRWASWSGATGMVDSGRTGEDDTNAAGGENDYLDEASATVVIADQRLTDLTTQVTAPNLAQPGEQVGVSVTFANLGSMPAEEVVYRLFLTPGLEGVDCSGIVGVVCTYDPRDGRLNLSGLPQTLAPGDRLSLQVTYTMPPQGSVEVWSEIATAATETDMANNQSRAITSPEDQPGGQLQLIKTAYFGHDAGTGCPGSKEISVVNKFRVPVDLTWCFSATNMSDEVWLDTPVFTDEGLGIGPGNQSGLRLRSGGFPLEPGATAIWYYEDNRDLSLLNYVELTMVPVEADGRPIEGADPATGSDSIPAIFGYVFDPPFGVKTGQIEGQDIVRWTMVWVNDNVIRANGVFITDPPPEGMTMHGAPICTPYGSTTVDSCDYEAPSAAFPRGRVLVHANLGPDFGVTVGTIGQAANRLEIAFDVLVDRPEAEVTYENQGTAEWTPPEVDETFESETYDLTQLEALDPQQPISELDPVEVPPVESPVNPRAQADLLLTKTVDDDRPAVGQRVTFTINVLNQGPSRATGVRVFDPLPSGYDLIAATSNQGHYDPATGYWSIGVLEVGTNVELQVVVRVRAAGEYANQAEVSGNEFDPRQDDNQDAVAPSPVIPPPTPHSIPTLSEWALVLLTVLMLGVGLHYHRARPRRLD